MTRNVTPTHDFHLGDIVKLNSGGPELTVIALELSKVVALCAAEPACFATIVVPAEALTLVKLNPMAVN